MLRKIAAVSLLTMLSAPLLAAECEVEIEGNDQMQFNMSEIVVDQSCKSFTVKLSHPGSLPKNVMGHNWVLTTTENMQAVITDGIASGLDNDYIKPEDERVIAHTKIIGAGESDSVTFDVAELDANGDYTFFCSFPGHASMMKGTLVVK